MFCRHCGAQIEQDSAFCSKCGGSQSVTVTMPSTTPERIKFLAYRPWSKTNLHPHRGLHGSRFNQPSGIALSS
ncbi:MAG: zinc ribbon domain-containing protein [Bryobacteraceae bacterium]